VIRHAPERCGGCGAELAEAVAVGVVARQVFDLSPLRQHGINMPDPQFTAGGIDQQPPTGADRDPRFKAAERACGQSLPPGKGGGGGR
jgi:hypothetical protein